MGFKSQVWQLKALSLGVISIADVEGAIWRTHGRLHNGNFNEPTVRGRMGVNNGFWVDACESWVSRMVLVMRLCVCSSRGCIGGKSQDTDFGGHKDITHGV